MRRLVIALLVGALIAPAAVPLTIAAATPGITLAPDVINAVFRAGADADHAAVDVTWDQAAKADSGGSGSAMLITRDGVSVECLTPATGSVTPSGGTAPGGNNTTKWTMTCGPIVEGLYAGDTPAAVNTARVLVLDDTAADLTHVFFNPLEQYDITPQGVTANLPDLIGVTFSKNVLDAANNLVDQAIFSFSLEIDTLNAPGSLGIVPDTGGGDAVIADSSGPFPGDEPIVVGKTVRVYFPVGTLTNAVQAFANAGAVTSLTGQLNAPASTGGGQAGVVAGPVVGTPRIRVVTNTTISATSVTVKLEWTVNDSGSPITSIVVSRSVNGGPASVIKTLSGSARSMTTSVSPSHTYAFTVRAVDAAGMDGERTSPVLQPELLAQVNSRTTYSGAWSTASSTTAIGGSTRYTRQIGATVTFRFTAREVAWIGPKGPTRGTVRVYVDGIYRKTVDLFASTGRARQALCDFAWSASGSHRITLKLVGTSARHRMDVDAWLIVD